MTSFGPDRTYDFTRRALDESDWIGTDDTYPDDLAADSDDL